MKAWKLITYSIVFLVAIFGIVFVTIIGFRRLVKDSKIDKKTYEIIQSEHKKAKTTISMKCYIFDTKIKLFNEINAKMPYIFGNYEKTNSTKEYAKCNPNCAMYKTNNIENQSPENLWFEIPNGYFVEIKNNDPTKDYIEVTYNNFTGFVSRSEVIFVKFEPKSPIFLPIEIQAGNVSTQLQELSATNSNALTVIEANDKLVYHASIRSTTPTGESSNIWHYVQYTPSKNPTKTYFGYVHSSRTTTPKVPENIEVEPITPITDELVADTDQKPVNADIKLWLKILLIMVIALPIIPLITYIIIHIRQTHTIT